MKFYIVRFVLSICLASIVFSCKKNDPIGAPYSIIGKWEWIKTLFVYPTDPLTPKNTGIQEILVFTASGAWYKSENGIKTDSGLYILGSGKYTPYPGAHTFIYDSIGYYKNSLKLDMGDYYRIFNDTLQFCPYFAGRYYSYSVRFNGSKLWRKQN
jgi:hypothetical protein